MNENVKLCLVNPPGRASSITVPVALLYLQSWLEKKGENVKIIDEKFGNQGIQVTDSQKSIVEGRILKRVESQKPEFVGIPCYTPEYNDVIQLCEKIKKIHNCKIIIGGLHVSIKPEDFFYENSPVDYAIAGDGFLPLVEVLRSKNDESLEDVAGLLLPTTKDIEKKKIGAPFEDWENMPNPDYSQIDMKYYTTPHTGIIRNVISSGIHIFTTIGCPFSCTYCANQSQKVRFRSISKVLDEIEGLKRDYSIDSFYILDDTFMIKKERVQEFITGLEERNIDLIWAMETRVNIINDEIVKTLKSAKCIQIDFGIESGSPASLKRMKKGINPEQIHNAFKICKKHKMRTLANFMFNTPHETKEDVEMTVEMIKAIKPTRVGLCLTIPFPGTPIYDEFVKPPLTKEEYNIYNTKYLYVLKGDPRFIMCNHDLDLVGLRINMTAKANGLRNLIDMTLDPLYWRSFLKSKRKIAYISSYSKGIFLIIIEKSRRIVNILKLKLFGAGN